MRATYQIRALNLHEIEQNSYHISCCPFSYGQQEGTLSKVPHFPSFLQRLQALLVSMCEVEHEVFCHFPISGKQPFFVRVFLFQARDAVRHERDIYYVSSIANFRVSDPKFGVEHRDVRSRQGWRIWRNTHSCSAPIPSRSLHG